MLKLLGDWPTIVLHPNLLPLFVPKPNKVPNMAWTKEENANPQYRPIKGDNKPTRDK